MIRALSLLLLSMLISACVDVGPPSSKGPAAFPATLERAFEAMDAIHVTPIDRDAFAVAGFKALGLPPRTSPSGRVVGQMLADAYGNNSALSAQGAEVVMQAFMAAGFEATLPDDVRFTRYVTPAQMYGFMRRLSESAGVGILVEPHPQGLKIIEVRDGGPAAKANLRPGDIITHVGGRRLASIDSLQSRISALGGRARTRVQLTIVRGGQSFTATMRREIQTLNDFGTPSLDDGIAYIPLKVFGTESAAFVAEAYESLAAQGDIRGVILDLRNNSGGSVGQATEIADLFLPAGTSLYRFRGRGLDYTTRARSIPLVLPRIPLAVLMNGDSASASEAVASALADQGRAVLIGATSFGKGTQQRLVTLPNGGAIALTNAFILRKNGRRISALGITPHICAAHVSSASALTRALRAGSQRPIQRQALATTRISRIDSLCPRVEGDGGHDSALARGVLGSSAAYRAALGL